MFNYDNLLKCAKYCNSFEGFNTLMWIGYEAYKLGTITFAEYDYILEATTKVVIPF